MWRWCQRTVQDAGGVARTIIGFRPFVLFHDLRERSVARVVSTSPTRHAASKPFKPSSSDEAAATPLVTPPDASGLIPVHTNPSARETRVARSSLQHADRDSGKERSPSLANPKFSASGSTILDCRASPLRGEARPRDTSSAIAKLRAILATKITEASARPVSADQLRSLYLNVRMQSHLGSLLPEEYSLLIRLFGSLSLSTRLRPYHSAYGHRLTPYMTETSYRPHWAVVMFIAMDKRGHRQPLNSSDHYWLMRTNVEALRTSEADVDTSQQKLQWIERSYSRLRQYPSADIHVPYLEAMFASSVAAHHQNAVKRLSELLKWYDGCPPTLLNLVWRVILQPPESLPEGLKLAIMDTIWRRLIDPSYGLDVSPVEASASQSSVLETTSSSDGMVHTYEPTSSIDLLPFLQGALFIRPTARVQPATKADGVKAWALSVARKVFSPDHLDEKSVEHRWSCFLLLAVASSPGRFGGATVTNSYAKWGAVVDWQTICALASLQNATRSKGYTFSVPFSEDVVQSLGGVLGALWKHWSSLPGLDHAVRPCGVTRAICASFLHLAGRFKNRGVVEACCRFCTTRRLWEEVSSSASLRSLVQEQLVALLISDHSTEIAVSATLECVRDEGLLSNVFSSVVSMFAPEDVALARELQSIARRVGVKLSTESSVVLALQLAKHGHISPAKECLTNTEFSPDQRLTIVHGIMTQFVQQGHRFRATHFSSDLADAIVIHLVPACPPVTMRPVIESTLLFMPRFQHSMAAVAIVEATARADKSYLSRTFWDPFIRSLLRHRQFRLVTRVHRLAQGLRIPGVPSSTWITAQLSNHGASNLAKKSGCSTTRESGVLAVARRVRYREIHPRKVATLGLPRFVHRRRFKRGPAVHRALQVLVRAGRMLAVKELYRKLHPKQSPSSRTALGNSIIHKSMQHPSRSQRHRETKAWRTLNELIDGYDFVPDRITINVLVKAAMQWTEGLTTQHLRALFDHFVRSGYPTGDVARTSVPFSTGEGPPPVRLPEAKSSLSYGKHVRPLYKMFVKAFYRRGDAAAARVVVGILKAVEAEAEDLHDAWMKRKRKAQSLGGKPSKGVSR